MTIRNLFINQIGNDKVLSYNFSDYDNIFIFFRNIYSEEGMLRKSFLEISQEYYEKYPEWKYKNIIIAPGKINYRSMLKDNLNYIIWFTSKANSYFNKDSIREKHIWKDVEWGKRKKNYSDKGKDPSNIWIPTEDDGAGHITKHILLDISDIVERLYKSTTQKTDTVVDFFDSELSSNSSKSDIISKINDSLEQFLNIDIKFNSSSNNEKFFLTSKQKVYFTTSEHLPVASHSVQLVVTSPPYWDLKNYFKKGQIGQESYCDYLDRLKKVWSECIRVLKDSGTIWININIRVKNGKPYFIPTDIIRQFRDLQMNLVDVVIWHKSSSIPVRDDNLTDKYEVVLCFSKNTKPNINNRVLETFQEYKNPIISGGTIWNINRKAGSVGKKMIHPAIYPTELIDRIIQLSTSIEDIVLDPFLGSGTTLISAIRNKRDGIGIEFNEGFKELIDYRITNEIIGEEFTLEYIETSIIK